MKKILLIFCFFVISYSCKQKQTSRIINKKPYIIDLSSNVGDRSLADIIEISDVIPLETVEKSIISKDYAIKRVIVKNEKIYILDNRFNGVKVFNLHGKYLYDLGNLGDRTGEFTIVQDICLYPPNKSIWVICNTPKKIIEFDENGQFIKEIDIPFYASAMAYENKNFLYFFNNQNPSKETESKNLIVTDSEMDIKGRLFNLSDSLNGSIDFSGNVYNNRNSIYYNPPFENIFYQLINGNAIAKYRFDFGSYNIVEKLTTEAVDSYIQKKAFLETFFVENDKYVGVKFIKKGRAYVAFHDITTATTFTSDTTSNVLNKLFNNSIFETDGKFIMLYSVDGMKTFFDKNKERVRLKYPSLYDKANKAKKNDNPLLIFFSLK